MGTLLDQMVVLRLQRMKPLPARINKAALREYAQPEQRAQLAALLRRIAAFAEGMRAMEKCVNLPWVIYCRGKLKVVLDNCFAQLAVSVILMHACGRTDIHQMSLQNTCCHASMVFLLVNPPWEVITPLALSWQCKDYLEMQDICGHSGAAADQAAGGRPQSAHSAAHSARSGRTAGLLQPPHPHCLPNPRLRLAVLPGQPLQRQCILDCRDSRKVGGRLP